MSKDSRGDKSESLHNRPHTVHPASSKALRSKSAHMSLIMECLDYRLAGAGGNTIVSLLTAAALSVEHFFLLATLPAVLFARKASLALYFRLVEALIRVL